LGRVSCGDTQSVPKSLSQEMKMKEDNTNYYHKDMTMKGAE